eukprot:GFUD01086478.1.p1 GENE.GFUD01086478.1~~GFUD01086478.1.p1  ORF type:complete len:201 (+),score=26.62 GFUD01086478.1:73-675(+)
MSKYNSSERLLAACRYSDFFHFSRAIGLICDNNADVNYYDGCSTPLNIALHNQNLHTAKYLLNVPGIDINKSDLYGRTPLHFSCYHNNIEIIRILCGDPALISLNSRDVSGKTPLMVAVQFGNIQAFKEMIKIGGVDQSTQNNYGQTLSYVARSNGRMDIHSLLQKKVKTTKVQLEILVPQLFVNLPEDIVRAGIIVNFI